MSFLQLLHNLDINRYEAAAVCLFVIGLCGLMFNRNLFKKIISMEFMDAAIFLFLTCNGGVIGHLAPIITDPSAAPSIEVMRTWSPRMSP